MSHISVSRITLKSHMQGDDVHSLLLVASYCFNELPLVRDAYAVGVSQLLCVWRHI
jgi:hypothetical protein